MADGTESEGSPSHLVTKVTIKRWSEAQEFEANFANRSRGERDDWNLWWRDRFNGYRILAGETFSNVLEVGAGPNTNVRLLLPLIKIERLFLEDPLMSAYLASEFATPSLRAKLALRRVAPSPLVQMLQSKDFSLDLSSAMLETLPYRDSSMDLIVCINVLDHVQDVDECLSEIRRVIRPKGVLVLGQDLSNAEDLRLAPDSYRDVGHPIKVDEEYLETRLGAKKALLKRVLPREEGRNPSAHYGTYLFIGHLA